MVHPQVLQLMLQPLLQLARRLHSLKGQSLGLLHNLAMRIGHLRGKLLQVRLAGLHLAQFLPHLPAAPDDLFERTPVFLDEPAEKVQPLLHLLQLVGIEFQPIPVGAQALGEIRQLSQRLREPVTVFHQLSIDGGQFLQRTGLCTQTLQNRGFLFVERPIRGLHQFGEPSAL